MSQREIKLQELGRRLVDREVYYCVSYLVSTLANAAANCHIDDLDYDDVLGLCQRDDWETPASEFILNDADFDELEQIADEYGYWSDIIEECGVQSVYEVQLFEDEVMYSFNGAKQLYDDEDEAKEAALEAKGRALRYAVDKLVDEDSEAPRWVCDKFYLDPYTNEVYEHWIVSNWLADKLEERGQITGDLLGLTIWGRCATGQSIALDHVIQQIAAELWPEELGDETHE